MCYETKPYKSLVYKLYRSLVYKGRNINFILPTTVIMPRLKKVMEKNEENRLLWVPKKLLNANLLAHVWSKWNQIRPRDLWWSQNREAGMSQQNRVGSRQSEFPDGLSMTRKELNLTMLPWRTWGTFDRMKSMGQRDPRFYWGNPTAKCTVDYMMRITWGYMHSSRSYTNELPLCNKSLWL